MIKIVSVLAPLWLLLVVGLATELVQAQDAPVPAPSPGFPTCNVCGVDGERVTAPDVELSLPTEDEPTPCGILETAGDRGFLDNIACLVVQTLTGPCECEIPPATDSPSAAPSATPSAAPVDPVPTAPDACFVCGSSISRVSLPDTVLEFPDQPDTTCGQLEQDGLRGLIPVGVQCVVASLTVQADCACVTNPTTMPSAMPSVMASATPTFIAKDSKAPVAAPLPPSPGFPPCNICGTDTGLRVTSPDTVIDIDVGEFVDVDELTCGIIQRAGDGGLINPGQCRLVQTLATNLCDCDVTMVPSLAPSGPGDTNQPSATPVQNPLPPSPGFPPCNVCGVTGSFVTLPNVVVEDIPETGPQTCAALFQAGMIGFIPPEVCPAVVVLAETCGCAFPTERPSHAPSQLPSVLPTEHPSAEASHSPSEHPSGATPHPTTAAPSDNANEDTPSPSHVPSEHPSAHPTTAHPTTAHPT
eukprot:CAMPEP_0116554488 /NCGR_PEP_ID=MMETSP0397-20121206/7620_1 /TAXON_ID=216820 /ORGANISM="Cyclophora tenuis, Strain ECT3854" /LENGTH=470 /DNA_ID=CAMNT_0004079655 /DNA_START=716 /DNA_END=2124 /DNA_ORIENTATION=-